MDLQASDLAAVKRQLQRIVALGEGKLTLTVEGGKLVNIGIFAEIEVGAPSLDNPNPVGELKD